MTKWLTTSNSGAGFTKLWALFDTNVGSGALDVTFFLLLYHCLATPFYG